MQSFGELLLTRARALAGATQKSGFRIPDSIAEAGVFWEVTAFTHWMRMAFPWRVHSAWAKLSNSCLGCPKINLLGTPDLWSCQYRAACWIFWWRRELGRGPTLQRGPVRQWELLHLLGLLTLFLAERGAGSSFQRSVKASWFAFTSKHDLSFSKILFLV